MSATVVITAETNANSLEGVQRVLDSVRVDAASLGLNNVKATHLRTEDGVIEPAGMGEQTVETVLTPAAPTVSYGDAADVINNLRDAVAAAQGVIALLDRGRS